MFNQKSNPTLGYIFILLTCVTNAVSFVFIANLNQTHNELLSLAATFGYATIVFNLINFRHIRPLYRLVANNFALFVKMNLVTYLSWLAAFYALNYLDPATVVCLCFGLIAVANFFIITPINRFKESQHLILCALFILLSMGLLISQYLTGSIHSVRETLLGVAWCMVSGFFGGFIGIYSVQMGNVGFTITQILATRFQILVIASLAAFLFTTQHTSIIIDWKYYFLASFLVVFLPLLTYQAAIKALGALLVSFLEPFTPIITYFLQIAVANYQFNPMRFCLLILTCIAIIWFVRIEHKMLSRQSS